MKVDQSADGPTGPTDVDGRAPERWGAWETSGIVDASAAFGPGAYLLDVQAHTLWIEKADGADNFAPAGHDFTNKREGGQLLLLNPRHGHVAGVRRSRMRASPRRHPRRLLRPPQRLAAARQAS